MKLTPYQNKKLQAIRWWLADKNDRAPKNPHLNENYIQSSRLYKTNRGSGRTTVLAYAYLEQGIKNQGNRIYPKDIVIATDTPTLRRNQFLLDDIVRLWKTQDQWNKKYVLEVSHLHTCFTIYKPR